MLGWRRVDPLDPREHCPIYMRLSEDGRSAFVTDDLNGEPSMEHMTVMGPDQLRALARLLEEK